MVSLWLVPSSEDAEQFMTIMIPPKSTSNNLSPLSYPRFHPHVTLASIPSTFSLERIRAALPIALKPLRIVFESLVIGDHYYRSVYLAIQLTEELQELHRAFHKAIGVKATTPAFPHCSMAYIANADAGERPKFVDDLRASGRVRDGLCEGVRGRNVSLKVVAEEDTWMSEWEAKEVWVVDCSGQVEGWKVLDKIPLRG